jgi:hypothetical protein
MSTILRQYKIFIWLCLGILATFIVRTLLAANYAVPRFFDLFDSLTVACSILICLRGFRSLHLGDWIAALTLAVLVGVGMLFATLFTPYPFFDIVRDNAGQAIVRGLFTFAAALGGLVIMRWGGPVMFHAAKGEWQKSGHGILFGLVVGVPLAIVNVIALQLTGGQTIAWQNPVAALLDALQPGIVEEIIYRFALWGLLWLALRQSLPERSVALAGLLATLVHTFSHFDALFVQAPLAALGMGLAMSLLWGLPLFFLARRRGLEAAVAFHWVQDAARFAAGL